MIDLVARDSWNKSSASMCLFCENKIATLQSLCGVHLVAHKWTTVPCDGWVGIACAQFILSNIADCTHINWVHVQWHRWNKWCFQFPYHFMCNRVHIILSPRTQPSSTRHRHFAVFLFVRLFSTIGIVCDTSIFYLYNHPMPYTISDDYINSEVARKRERKSAYTKT